MTERLNAFAVTLAQLNPTMGDIEGNAAKVRAARARAIADGADLVLFPELFIAGYPPEDLVQKPAFQAACRAAIEALARETADGGPAHAGRHALGRGRQALQCLRAARRRPHRRVALQMQSAELRRVRREAAVFARPGSRPRHRARRADRRADLRGHLAGRVRGLRERGRDAGRDRRRDHSGAERLALCPRQERCASVGRGRARHRERPAAGLSQPGLRPGRTRVRRRVLRAQRRSLARRAIAGVRGERHDLALHQERRRLALHGSDRGAARGRQGRLCGLRAGLARLCQQERLSRRAARHLRRHRFRTLCGDRGRCAGRRPGARRDAALSLHGGTFDCGRRRARRPSRHPLRGAADRGSRGRLRDHPRPASSRTCRPISPRKTSRPAPAARC